MNSSGHMPLDYANVVEGWCNAMHASSIKLKVGDMRAVFVSRCGNQKSFATELFCSTLSAMQLRQAQTATLVREMVMSNIELLLQRRDELTDILPVHPKP